MVGAPRVTGISRRRRRWRRDRRAQVAAVGTMLALLLIVVFITEYALQPLSSEEQNEEVQHALLVQNQVEFIQSSLLTSVTRPGTLPGAVEPVTLGSQGVPPFGAPSSSALSIGPAGTGVTVSVPTSSPQPTWDSGSMCSLPTGALRTSSGGVATCTFYAGTAPGSGPKFQAVGGNSAVAYIPLNLTNNQTTATSAGLQVMVTVNPRSIGASHFASNLANVNWQDGNGHILPSWLENGTSSASTSTVYWINLGSNTIPGSGGVFTIYMVIYAPSVPALDGTDTGAEPSYSAIYGQFDNGANVFGFYDNFAGTKLNTAWNTIGCTACYVVHNGLDLSPPTVLGYVFSLTNLYASPIIVDSSMYGSAAGSTYIGVAYSNLQSNTPTSLNVVAGGMEWTSTTQCLYYSGSSEVCNAANPSLTVPQVDSLAVASSKDVAYQNYGNALSTAATTPASDYPGITAYSSGDVFVEWFRTRTYPPNGVMPSTSIGTLTQAVTVPQTPHGMWNESESHTTWIFELPTASDILTESINWTGNWDNITIYQGASNMYAFNFTLLGNHDNVYLCYGGITSCQPGSASVALNDHHQLFDIYGQYDTWQLGAGPGIGGAASAGGHDFMNVVFSGENASQPLTTCPNGTLALTDKVGQLVQANNPTGNVLNITYYDDTGYTTVPHLCPPATCVNQPLTTWTNLSLTPATEAACAWEDGLLAGPTYVISAGLGSLDVFLQNRYIPPEMIALEGGAVVADVPGKPSFLLDPPLFAFQETANGGSGTLTLVTFSGAVPNDQGYTTVGVETLVARTNILSLSYGERLGGRFIGSPGLTVATQFPAAWVAYLNTISNYTSGPVNCTHTGGPYPVPYTCLDPPSGSIVTLSATLNLQSFTIRSLLVRVAFM
jgi:hypothetical protein